ncbi:methyltransferase family protein [Salinilacihabitans rarus]|uniref:methyltransferase family protein n=1 Tax=Salinilacihabitans rarus TaxID=2961596 RepID=UPI0020C9004F|nr:isoprenylcysteine carboxylmethyltransferase family protein [Salinilacihabitans rarus]
MEPFDRWADQEYTAAVRLFALVPQTLFFALAVPVALVTGGRRADEALGLPRFDRGPVGALGSPVAALGLTFATWSIAVQFVRGEGTPVPRIPTQELVADGPYRYSRNPMSFGTTLYYLGVSLRAGSPSAVCLTGLFTASQVAYIKRVEERELEDRFGGAYREYRERTPFYVPRPGRER